MEKIGILTDKHIEIKPNHNSWPIFSTFEITPLKARTLSTEHVIYRQDSIDGYPKTKIRDDKPIYINLKTNALFQKDPLKVRVYNRQRKKEISTFLDTFAHELSVINKMQLYAPIKAIQENQKINYSDKKQAIRKAAAYKIGYHNLHPAEKPTFPHHTKKTNYNGLLNINFWMQQHLAPEDRLNLMLLTAAEMIHITRNYRTRNIETLFNSKQVEETMFQWLGRVLYWSCGQEELTRFYNIATYEEPK